MAGHLLTRPRLSAAYSALNLGVREINRWAESPSEPTALPDLAHVHDPLTDQPEATSVRG
jgi:hypothetical protein